MTPRRLGVRVLALLGHKSIATTQRYAHLVDSALATRRAASGRRSGPDPHLTRS